MTGEFELIRRLTSLIPPAVRRKFRTGDDAAVVPLAGGRSLLFSTDSIVEGVDFLIRGKGAGRPGPIGHKALAVNLSDIAAMGAKPVAFVTAWGIPKGFSEGRVLRAAKGIARLARRFQTAWVGGDISRANRFFISIAILGEARTGSIVYRKGARSGDWIYVTGTLGGSILGRHLSFIPRVREARYLAEHFSPTAMIDLSDGFIQDLGQILGGSHVGAEIELDRIPVSRAARTLARGSNRRALESALTDGEDFELLFTIPPRHGKRLEKSWRKHFPAVRLTRVGVVRRGPGRMAWFEKGKRLEKLWFRKRGFVHF